MPTSAAFFDLDKTVIAKSSTLAFGRPLYRSGLISRSAVLRSSYAQFVYLLAGASEDQLARLRDYSAGMVAGWPVAQVRQIVEETLPELIQPLVYAEALRLITAHKRAGREVVIISSSGEDVVAPIGQLVGADRVIATRMRVEDGRYTSQVEFYAYGPNKATAMREIAASSGYELADCYAYSDSITDAPMLDAVGHPTAVDPDRALRRLANERNWPVARFRRPIRGRGAFSAGRKSPEAGIGAPDQRPRFLRSASGRRPSSGERDISAPATNPGPLIRSLPLRKPPIVGDPVRSEQSR